ncbi:MAG: bifunctional 5,10-methylenetetrahydrofolate dehydrogenase/5,10-methenyltetrahydrofolate cyclohydrolase [Patescibacteria group bacterium]
MIIFNGDKLSAQLEQNLKQEVQVLHNQGIQLKIAAILFKEDRGSQLYTQLKSEAAKRVGIDYEVCTFSMTEGTDGIEQKIIELNKDETVTGIIIQKPWRNTWAEVKGIVQEKGQKAVRQAFNAWWQLLTSKIDQQKDVDGLHPDTLTAIKDNTWQKQHKVLPATAKAVLTILDKAFLELKISQDKQRQKQIFILGWSDIVGQPVFYELQNKGFNAKVLTRDDVNQRLSSSKKLTDADVIISATGVKHLISGKMVKKGVIVIDVGEPRPDVDFESMKTKAAFITPVPGGVGPMTVVGLLKNCVTINA